MWYITALLVGLAGSLHCAGMCGPIVIALPSGVVGGIHLWNTRILYNLGRILTYGILGAMIGIIGQGLFLGGLQRWVPIAENHPGLRNRRARGAAPQLADARRVRRGAGAWHWNIPTLGQ